MGTSLRVSHSALHFLLTPQFVTVLCKETIDAPRIAEAV